MKQKKFYTFFTVANKRTTKLTIEEVNAKFEENDLAAMEESRRSSYATLGSASGESGVSSRSQSR